MLFFLLYVEMHRLVSGAELPKAVVVILNNSQDVYRQPFVHSAEFQNYFFVFCTPICKKSPENTC